jgi:hypothetical protein
LLLCEGTDRLEPHGVAANGETPSRGLAAITRACGTRGVAGLRRVAPCRFARVGDQGCAFIAELKIRVGPLRGVLEPRPAPVPGARGFASFTLRVNEPA